MHYRLLSVIPEKYDPNQTKNISNVVYLADSSFFLVGMMNKGMVVRCNTS